MPSDKISQQQSELSDTNDELIPEQQKRDVRAERRRSDRTKGAKNSIAESTFVADEDTTAPQKDKGNGLVDISERSKRARSSG